MPRGPRPIDRSKLRTEAARRRKSRVRARDEAQPHRAGASFADFLDGLPAVLGAADLRTAIDAWGKAWSRGRTVLFGFGAHVLKVGLGPLLVDLLERGAVTALMTQGAACVHDLELALMGRTSEDVGPALDEGRFGMARETAEGLNRAIAIGAQEGRGMGESVGAEILNGRYPHRGRSVLATAARLGVPVTVHSAIGTDIHHMHASADGAALGATSYRDFETLAGIVAGLEGGIVFNVGSAVILPEVFLKSLALARNLGYPVRRFTAVNLDFQRQYRAEQNLVRRPTRLGGRGLSLIGHHEVLLPLLAAGVIERRASAERPRRRTPRGKPA